MHFFEKYDFFNFNLFNTNFNVIFDKNFISDNWVKTSPPSPHSHETWELYFVRSGNIYVDCTNSKITISQNQFALIPPNTNHFIYNVDNDTSFGSIRFSLSISNNDNIGLLMQSMISKTSLLATDASDEMVEGFDLLKSLYKKYNSSSNVKIWIYPKITARCLMFFSSLFEFISKLENHDDFKNFKSKQDLSPLIIEFFMLYAADESATINDLAENINYSVSQTNRILMQKFRKSFRTLMRETKISKAKYYLLRTDFSIQKISDILGFKEPKSFNRSFKELVGMTPTAYRKQNTPH